MTNILVIGVCEGVCDRCVRYVMGVYVRCVRYVMDVYVRCVRCVRVCVIGV